MKTEMFPMEKVIEILKGQIADAKEWVVHYERITKVLYERLEHDLSKTELKCLQISLEDARDQLQWKRELLGDLRNSLTFALRANGMNPFEINVFEPESQC